MGHHSRFRPRSGCGRASCWSSTSGHVMPGRRTLRFVPPRSQAPAVRIPLEPARAECEQQVQGARRSAREAEGSLLARHVPCSTGATHARSRSVAGSGCDGPRADRMLRAATKHTFCTTTPDDRHRIFLLKGLGCTQKLYFLSVDPQNRHTYNDTTHAIHEM